VVSVQLRSMVEAVDLLSAEKQQARKQWNATPCGTGEYLAEIEPESLEFFEAVRRSRYERTDRWMTRTIPFAAARGKRVLEIGHGLGTDLVSFALAGAAQVCGIDITEEHHRLALRNFELRELACTLKLCDAAAIEFPAEAFDIVYSHGVLHHTPDTVRCVSEAYRVLKPGGQLILSLYHTYSLYHLLTMLVVQGVLRGKLRRLGYRGLMATVEYGADGVHTKPLVKTYSKRQLRHILGDFRRVEFKIAHLTPEQIPWLGRLIPAPVLRLLEPHLGWYVIAFATK
jgi:ubiquinone/menaquinone biosynthesis C-methylase UbiE